MRLLCKARLVVLLLPMCSASTAYADLLGLELFDAPDVLSGFIDVTFDAGGDAFVASGFALTYDDDGLDASDPIANGTFDITASIDDVGSAGAGSLSIGGIVAGLGSPLLTGDLLDFGFVNGGGRILEFLFEVTGGDLAPDFGGTGAVMGLILDVEGGGYGGDWSVSFDNLIGGIPGTGSGVSDAGIPVPEPGSAFLIALGSALLASSRRRHT